MRKQKQYTSREQIVKEIDDLEKELVDMSAKAADLSSKARELFVIGDPASVLQANGLKEESEELWRSVSLIKDKKLPRLGRTLAVFDTIPMFGEKSVKLEK